MLRLKIATRGTHQSGDPSYVSCVHRLSCSDRRSLVAERRPLPAYGARHLQSRHGYMTCVAELSSIGSRPPPAASPVPRLSSCPARPRHCARPYGPCSVAPSRTADIGCSSSLPRPEVAIQLLPGCWPYLTMSLSGNRHSKVVRYLVGVLTVSLRVTNSL